MRRYLATLPAASDRLGGSADEWDIREVGDGNLNQVFLIEGREGGICVKQSLPHVRVLESWRLPVERTFFEYSYFRIVGPFVDGLVPSVYHFEAELFALVMERLAPHVVLRRGLIAGREFPRVARDIAEYVARASYHTSDFGRRFESKFDHVALFAKNDALVRITVDLIFTDPYREAERNRWTSPQLDDVAAAFRADPRLRIAVARLGYKFLTNTQALIHGDLHSGSVMVTETDTRVIDPEFALYGPIGFDLGAFLGNLLISYFSQSGHATANAPRTTFGEWILTQAAVFWIHFRARFLELWTSGAAGDGYARDMFADEAGRRALSSERERFVDALYADMIGFAAVKMIRRILGFAHVADFAEILDADRRAACERATLELARTMLVEPERFEAIDALVATARHYQSALISTVA